MSRFVAFVTLLFAANAQIEHFGEEEIFQRWEVFTNPVGQGNGVFLSPREDVLVVVSSNGVVRALNPFDGVSLWSFPSTPNTQATGGAFFSQRAAIPFVTYCVSNGASSQVIGINLATGAILFTTGAIQGECVGTPVTTEDGLYVLVTHNVNDTVGFFSIYEVANPSTASFTYQYDGVEAPFGAIGHYWNPLAGYYDEGAENTNDIFIWGLDAREDTNGTIGQIFAFQMPMTLGAPPFSYNVTTVGGERNFVSPLPPVITNNGFSMYWAVSRSEQRAWVGEQGLGRRDFGTNGVGIVGFRRGTPARAAAGAPPSLSSDPVTPFVIGPTASNQLFLMSFDFAEGDAAITVDTSVPVTSRVLISPDDTRAYYATPSPDGNIYGIGTSSLEQFWNLTIAEGVSGEMALSLNGDTLYLADALGGVRAYAVADAPPATLAPTISPVNQTASPVVGTFSPAPGGPNSTVATGIPASASPGPSATFVPTVTMRPTASASNVTDAPDETGMPTDAPGTDEPEETEPPAATPPPENDTPVPTPPPVDVTPEPTAAGSNAPGSDGKGKGKGGKDGTDGKGGKGDVDGKVGKGDVDGGKGKRGNEESMGKGVKGSGKGKGGKDGSKGKGKNGTEKGAKGSKEKGVGGGSMSKGVKKGDGMHSDTEKQQKGKGKAESGKGGKRSKESKLRYD